MPERMRIDSTGYVGIGGVPTTNGRLYISGPGSSTNFLELANCFGYATLTSGARALAGFVRLYINNTVTNGSNPIGTGAYFIAVYS
jgi:hypothetical protein